MTPTRCLTQVEKEKWGPPRSPRPYPAKSQSPPAPRDQRYRSSNTHNTRARHHLRARVGAKAAFSRLCALLWQRAKPAAPTARLLVTRRSPLRRFSSQTQPRGQCMSSLRRHQLLRPLVLVGGMVVEAHPQRTLRLSRAGLVPLLLGEVVGRRWEEEGERGREPHTARASPHGVYGVYLHALVCGIPRKADDQIKHLALSCTVYASLRPSQTVVSAPLILNSIT